MTHGVSKVYARIQEGYTREVRCQTHLAARVHIAAVVYGVG